MNTVIACASIKPELERLKDNASGLRVCYLPQNLHRTPGKLKELLQKNIDRLAKDGGKMVLGYGLCSNALVGLKAPEQGLYVPRAHDCITFFLGGRNLYKEAFAKNPGTYYLTRSWIDNQKDPLGQVENEYTERVGRSMAEEAMETEIRNYRYIGYVAPPGAETGDEHSGNPEEENRYLQRAKENASFFGKELMCHKGNDAMFRKILFGPYAGPDFIHIKPSETVKQSEFLK